MSDVFWLVTAINYQQEKVTRYSFTYLVMLNQILRHLFLGPYVRIQTQMVPASLKKTLVHFFQGLVIPLECKT